MPLRSLRSLLVGASITLTSLLASPEAAAQARIRLQYPAQPPDEYCAFSPTTEYRVVPTDDPKAKGYMAWIERFPDHVQRFLTRRGWRVVFFKGQLTDQPEWHDAKGHPVRSWAGNYTWDKLPYAVKGRTTYFGTDGEYYNVGSQEMHEIGHVLSRVYGLQLRGKEMTAWDDLLDLYNKYEGTLRHCQRHPSEWLADCWADYYNTTASREGLRAENPELHEMLGKADELMRAIDAAERAAETAVKLATEAAMRVANSGR